MAVMQNSIIFGGVDSADFGIYIGGEGVFNAPKRAVEMVTVPGRNGDIAIDQGHYENIEVTYSAFNYEEDLETFAKQLSDFRNAIVSQVGYQRLTDTFHPDEYRMAIYTEGLEIDPIKYNTASEFELKFNCKPQRWLTSGEIPVTIGEWGATETASGEIVTIESEGGETAKSLEVSLEPIQAGSGEPSPDNVRPISGRTEVVTRVAGKNLLPIIERTATTVGVTATINADGSVTLNGTATGNGGILLTESSSGKWLTEGTYYGKLFGNNLEGLSFQAYNNGSAVMTRPSGSFVIPSDSKTNYMRVRWASGTVFDNVTVYPMLTIGTTEPTTYIAPQTEIHTTALGRTVYGGTLDVVSGVLTVDKVMLEWLSSSNFGKGGATTVDEFFLRPSLAGVSGAWRDAEHIICSHAKNVESTSGVTAPYPQMGNGQPRIVFPLSMGMSLANFKTWLDEQQTNGTPLQVCYMLATPQTYQLTPQAVELLVGENHLWSDGAITMQYGDDPNSLWNPTRYDAGPLLAVKGHGDVSFNGYTVAIDAGQYGVINVKGKQTSTAPITYTTDVSLYNDGDTIYAFVECDWVLTTLRNIYARSYSNQHDTGVGQTVMEPRSTSGNNRAVGTTIIDSSVLSSQDETLTNTFSFDSELSNGTTVTVSVVVEVTWSATNKTLSVSSSVPHATGWGGSHRTFPTITIEAASTKTYLGDPTLVDCELGEAYKVEDGEIISLNKYIELGSDLPTLSSGANDVTTDNTITELQVTPNWWKL